MGKKRNTDWAAIELDYRAGVKSLRQMGAEYGVSESAIRKRGKNEGWQRDLLALIRMKADELVRESAVRSEYAENHAPDIVAANTRHQAQIRLRHRLEIAKAMEIFEGLMYELEAVSSGVTDLERVIHGLEEGDSTTLAQQMQRLVTLPARIAMVEKLTCALKVLIRLERVAYGIDDRHQGQAQVPANVSIHF